MSTKHYLHNISTQLPIFIDFLLLNYAQKIQNSLLLLSELSWLLTSLHRNVILVVGDGMSLTTATAARILRGQRRGQSGEDTDLAWDTFPAVALAKVSVLWTPFFTPDSSSIYLFSFWRTHLVETNKNGKKIEQTLSANQFQFLAWVI